MLELRPNCEHCNQLLPPNSLDAMICSFECTFCKNCVQSFLKNVCPNCGGGFTQRPIRPAKDRSNGNYLGNYPASRKIVYKPVEEHLHSDFALGLCAIDPENR